MIVEDGVPCLKRAERATILIGGREHRTLSSCPVADCVWVLRCPRRIWLSIPDWRSRSRRPRISTSRPLRCSISSCWRTGEARWFWWMSSPIEEDITNDLDYSHHTLAVDATATVKSTQLSSLSTRPTSIKVKWERVGNADAHSINQFVVVEGFYQSDVVAEVLAAGDELIQLIGSAVGLTPGVERQQIGPRVSRFLYDGVGVLQGP